MSYIYTEINHTMFWLYVITTSFLPDVVPGVVSSIYLAVVGYGTLPQALRYDLRDNPTNNVVLNSLDLSGLQLVYDTKYTYDENDGAVIQYVTSVELIQILRAHKREGC